MPFCTIASPSNASSVLAEGRCISDRAVVCGDVPCSSVVRCTCWQGRPGHELSHVSVPEHTD
eukprot:10235348-Alexandrium_andersonii.AAC.1